MQRPDWLPAKLWKELREYYPKVERREWPTNKVTREPRLDFGKARLRQAAEYYPATAEVDGRDILLSWQTGTGQRGNEWGFRISEEALLKWLEGLRQAKREEEARQRWHENHILDVLFAWLQHHKPESDMSLYRVRRMLKALDGQLYETALSKLNPRARRKPLAKKKPPAKKKAVARPALLPR